MAKEEALLQYTENSLFTVNQHPNNSISLNCTSRVLKFFKSNALPFLLLKMLILSDDVYKLQIYMKFLYEVFQCDAKALSQAHTGFALILLILLQDSSNTN